MNPDLEYARSRMAERLRRAEQARSVAEAREQPVAPQVRQHPPVAEPIAVEASCGQAAVDNRCKAAHVDVAA
jgi:hypothetical protein